MISSQPSPNVVENYDRDSRLVPPTFSQSVFRSARAGEEVGTEAINLIGQYHKQNIQDTWDAIQLENQQESELLSTGQKAFRWLPEMLANTVGMLKNPISAPIVAAGGIAGKAIAAGAPFAAGALGIAPESIDLLAGTSIRRATGLAVGRFLPRTVGEAGTIATESAGAMAGFAVPEAVIENYNKDTNSINWGGFTQYEMANGALGVAFAPIGYALGALFKGIFKEGKAPIPGQRGAVDAIKTLESAYNEGKISKDEFEWGRDLYTDPHMPDLQGRASDLLIKRGHPVDSAKAKAYFEMLSPEKLDQLKQIFPYELSHALEGNDNNALSDYVVHASLDDARQHPEKIDGMRGWLNEAEAKLAAKDVKLKEANEIVSEHLHTDMTEKMPLDQKDIYKAALEAKEAHIPFTVPDQVDKLLRQHAEINDLKQENTKLKRLLKKTGQQKYQERLSRNEDRLSQLENEKTQLLSPKEELTHIREKLLSEKGLPDNYKLTKSYQRLSELAEIWHNARTLLDRINLEANYKDLEGKRDLFNAFLKVIDSNIEKFADPNRVANYLKNRIDRQSGIVGEIKEGKKARTIKTPDQIMATAKKKESKPDEVLKQFKEEVMKSDSKELIDGYKDAEKRYTQFREAKNKIVDMFGCLGRKG